ncbi:Retrovirus-related Pol polyprotein, partial [Mucuna pruriens]
MDFQGTCKFTFHWWISIRRPSHAHLVHSLTPGCHLAYATLRRCMISIFSDLLEECMEVFMDDFIVYAESFYACLENLSLVLHRCMETNLVLNCKKCHFMVIEGIVLGHLVSSRGIELDKAKVDQDFLALVQAALEGYGLHLRSALCGSFPGAEEAPNWEYLFELMCDVSNSTLGAVLGQRINKQPHVIAYTSQTMDLAQINYTITEKELLAIVLALDKFCSYIMGSKIIEFDLEIKEKKGAENAVTDHLSCLERGVDPLPI